MGPMQPPKADPGAIAAGGKAVSVTLADKIDAAGPSEFVPVTRAEFDALKREVAELRDDIGSDRMAAALSRC